MSSVSVVTRRSHNDVLDVERMPSELIDMKLLFRDGAAYLSDEIMEWLEAHQETAVSPASSPSSSPASSVKLPPLRRLEPRFQGVPITIAIAHQFRVINEQFKHNPYGLGGGWFWVVLVAAFSFVFGHVAAGALEGLASGIMTEHGMRLFILKAVLPTLRGGLNGLPIVWMLVAFCFPALIANLQDQFSALGLEVHL